MATDQLQDEVSAVFREVFDDPALEITSGMTADDVEQWDSLSHINLIVALEGRFGIRFRTAEISSPSNVGELISLIQHKAAQKNR